MIDYKRLQAVAESILETEIYLVAASELKTASIPESIFACTGPILDLTISADLHRMGRWDGRKPAIVMGDKQLRQHGQWIGEGCGDGPQTGIWRLAGSALVHECTHIVERESNRLAKLLAESKPSPNLVDFAFDTSETLRNREQSTDLSRKHAATTHGPKFVRLAAHVSCRAIERSLDLYVDEVYDYRVASQPPLPLAWDWLENEPQRLRHLRLTEVAKIQPPPRFTESFEEYKNGPSND